MDKIRINLYDLLTSISKAQDLVSKNLLNHHKQVAYLALRLAEQIDLSPERKRNLFLAALIHDIGALSSRERLELIENEPVSVNDHAFRGARLIEGFKPLSGAADIIRFHHVPWNYGKGIAFKGWDVPFESHIINLADKTSTSIRSGSNIISQLPDIMRSIGKLEGTMFNPKLVEALSELSRKEYIWLDFTSHSLDNMNDNDIDIIENIHTIEIDDLIDFALVLSQIIDFRSSFTARHSAGVANTAVRIAEMIGFPPYECKMMLIAGYLHDLGKIAISDDILEKPSKLNADEFNEIRAHTYYTYRLLEPINQLKTINAWASFHHERLDGTGYPFHISGDSLSLGSRIMAVADVFTAITEDRPYREGMDYERTKKVLESMVENNALDRRVVNLVIDNFDDINSIRERSQASAAEKYNNFLLAKI